MACKLKILVFASMLVGKIQGQIFVHAAQCSHSYLECVAAADLEFKLSFKESAIMQDDRDFNPRNVYV